ncbi:ketopantoate reductase family protein [Isoalcanivorax indicus]|uniref:ketopantoate reductase family protein n=1 Tax=Isoalcanivorax indicus TaxID=2202653 RepID=UPI000DB93C4A|nr:2-dehydropantoate 2-reductase [Isoalcanivorax indicus]
MTWHLLGAGNIGTLVASYLIQAQQPLRLAGRGGPPVLRTLIWPQGAQRTLTLPGDDDAPISQLLITTKAQDTAAALRPLLPRLTDTVLLVRLQNGLGSLDGLPLPDGSRIIEGITTSGAWRDGPRIQVVAENDTLLGDADASPEPPAAIAALLPHWPGARWCTDIRRQQWLKLSVNAVINPITALNDCPNGALCDDPARQQQARALAEEADALLRRLDPDWPGDTYGRALAVAQATAANMSSMRADLRAGQRTEIAFINGWLLRQADRLGMSLPSHRLMVAALPA